METSTEASNEWEGVTLVVLPFFGFGGRPCFLGAGGGSTSSACLAASAASASRRAFFSAFFFFFRASQASLSSSLFCILVSVTFTFLSLLDIH